MDEPEKDELEDDAILDDDLDDDLLLPKGKKAKGIPDELLGEEPESLDALAEEEDELLPEDAFDDIDLF